ncbi:MAG: hypothetical protein QM279_06115, partial [Atribacterota bacterium]|nr:hypothetical protein [Atribacterota bacterium]
KFRHRQKNRIIDFLTHSSFRKEGEDEGDYFLKFTTHFSLLFQDRPSCHFVVPDENENPGFIRHAMACRYIN